ncbi:hypothetical protein VTL71DRAFT_14110 [Oculimacula yallundae]|uniref:Uncharacterized protein n=1 Tax=Oculimacula yallundae TaxID=86028 RepID=A0ABR4CHI6_9HELO
MDSRSVLCHTNTHNPKDESDWPSNLVTWNGPKDPLNSQNWPLRKKMGITVLLGFTTISPSPSKCSSQNLSSFCFAIYNSFVYELLYLLFEAKEIAAGHPFKARSSSSLCWKLDKAHKKGDKNDPEARLPPMMLRAVLFAAPLFWFSGGSGIKKSRVISIFGAGCIGAGFILIFQNAVNYLIDAFTVHAASAQAANTFLRSLAGAGFPLFAPPMFLNLGVNWASFTMNFIAMTLIPIPILVYVFGKRLRDMSRYDPDKES